MYKIYSKRVRRFDHFQQANISLMLNNLESTENAASAIILIMKMKFLNRMKDGKEKNTLKQKTQNTMDCYLHLIVLYVQEHIV